MNCEFGYFKPNIAYNLKTNEGDEYYEKSNGDSEIKIFND